MNFEQELRDLINRHSLENGSDTPDYILAEYLVACLRNFETTIRQREKWYGINPKQEMVKNETT